MSMHAARLLKKSMPTSSPNPSSCTRILRIPIHLNIYLDPATFPESQECFHRFDLYLTESHFDTDHVNQFSTRRRDL